MAYRKRALPSPFAAFYASSDPESSQRGGRIRPNGLL